METKLLNILSCPKCRKKLKILSVYKGDHKHVINGLVSCTNHTFPIIGGVLFLEKSFLVRTLQKHQEIFTTVSDVPFFLFKSGKLVRSSALMRLAIKFNPFSKLNYSLFIRLFCGLGLINRDWAKYLLNRTRRADFTEGKLIVKREVVKRSVVLDMASGSGQMLAYLGRTKQPKLTCGIDFSLPNLYLAHKYISPKANLIYFNLNKGLPFLPKTFNYILCNDAFHYFNKQQKIAGQAKKTLKTRGTVILTHLHNRLFEDTFVDPPHHPQTYQKYLSFFPAMKHFFYSPGSKKPNRSATFSLVFRN